MKLSHLAYGVAGYVLGARAGRDRYDQIVSLARRVAGSQTVQSTAGVVQGQLDQAAAHARQTVAARLGGQIGGQVGGQQPSKTHPAASDANGRSTT